MTVVDATDRPGERRFPHGPRHHLVTEDGFARRAVRIDPATGCHLWRATMNGREPRARYRGVAVKPRILAFERAFGSLPQGYRLDPCPNDPRCIRPDHQVTKLIGATHPADKVAARQTLAGRLPAERPPHIKERDWKALCGVVAGRTYAEVGIELGISRQRVGQIVDRARQELSQDRG